MMTLMKPILAESAVAAKPTKKIVPNATAKKKSWDARIIRCQGDRCVRSSGQAHRCVRSSGQAHMSTEG